MNFSAWLTIGAGYLGTDVVVLDDGPMRDDRVDGMPSKDEESLQNFW